MEHCMEVIQRFLLSCCLKLSQVGLQSKGPSIHWLFTRGTVLVLPHLLAIPTNKLNNETELSDDKETPKTLKKISLLFIYKPQSVALVIDEVSFELRFFLDHIHMRFIYILILASTLFSFSGVFFKNKCQLQSAACNSGLYFNLRFMSSSGVFFENNLQLQSAAHNSGLYILWALWVFLWK